MPLQLRYALAALLTGLLAATPAAGQVVILHSFGGGSSDGAAPFGSLTSAGSALYGMTNGGGVDGSGTVFRFGVDGSGFALLHSFAGGLNDGSTPNGSLI